MRRALQILLVLAAAAALWLVLRWSGPSVVPVVPAVGPAGTPAHVDGEPGRQRALSPGPAVDSAGVPVAVVAPADGANAGPDIAAGLREALTSGDADRTRAAAAELRRLLRTDAAAWDAAVRSLLDPNQDAALREALALVLGTIDAPRTDAVLLDALRQVGAAGGPEDLRRVLLLALGATRDPPDKDDVFDFGDRPWGEDGPSGIGITVRRRIDDAAVRAALKDALRDAPAETRRSAAVALRHSLASTDALDAFVAALRDEQDDAPVAVVGEALAGLARSTPSAEERDRLLRVLFARVGDESLDGLRFRVSDDLDRVRLPQDVTDTLHALAVSDRSFGVRAFAIDVLVGSAVAPGPGGDADLARVRALLVHVLEGDTDPALRDLAARHLRRLAVDAVSGAALLRALRNDAAWNVRYTALDTLVRLRGVDVPDALAAGNQDGDERVRALAAELSARK